MVDICGFESSFIDNDNVTSWVEGILFPPHPTKEGVRLVFGIDNYGHASFFESINGKWCRHHRCTETELVQLDWLDGIVETESCETVPSSFKVVTGWSCIKKPAIQVPPCDWEAELAAAA